MHERLPGFRDFYPEDCAKRNFLFRVWSDAARCHGFHEYDIPTLEPLQLFTEKSGPEIVSQLFNFTDKGGREVALRPELTPSLARMVGAKISSLPKPLKWFNIAENFRYEKPQEGRLRSHYQLNCDIFGEPGPGADAELIATAIACLRSFGPTEKDFVLRLSDRDLWMLFLASLGHEGESALGVLGVIDKLERMPREQALEKLAPFFGDAREDFFNQVESILSLRSAEELGAFFLAHAPNADLRGRIEARLADWTVLLDSLRAMGLGPFIRVDLGIVRGLAYYTGFVFEIFKLDADGALAGRALAGGGRYDHLIGKLGFPETAAVGFGMGDVTMAQFLEERGCLPKLIEKPDVFVVLGDGEARTLGLGTAGALRAAGVRTEYPLRAVGFGKQFRLAGQSGARLAVIVGEDEAARRQIRVKDLTTGGEVGIFAAHAVEAIRTFLDEGIPPTDAPA